MEKIPSPLRDPPHAEPGLGDNALRHQVHGAMHDELRLDPDRQRRQKGASAIDPFDISDIMAKYAPTRGEGTPEQVAKEIDFNWKRYETYGKPDYSEQRFYQDQGWKAVQHHHFPGRFAP